MEDDTLYSSSSRIAYINTTIYNYDLKQHYLYPVRRSLHEDGNLRAVLDHLLEIRAVRLAMHLGLGLGDTPEEGFSLFINMMP